MVDILPGSYCDQRKETVRICVDHRHHYLIQNYYHIIKAVPYLDHKSYWLADEDSWIYIAPNELNRW